MSSEQTPMTDERQPVTARTCPTCGHRPHQPLGCKARYHVTFEKGEPGDPCLCENWRAEASPAASGDALRLPEGWHVVKQIGRHTLIERDADPPPLPEGLDVDWLGHAMEQACDDLSVHSLSPADAPILHARLSGKEEA